MTTRDQDDNQLTADLADWVQKTAGEEVWLPEKPRPAPARTSELPWYGHWSLLIVIGAFLLFMLRGGVATTLGVGAIAGLSLAFVALSVKTIRFGTEVIYGLSDQPPAPRAAMASPLVPIRSKSEQLHSLTTSAFFAPLSVTALTGAMSLVRPDLLELHLQNPNLSLATLFVTVATLGTWMISLLSTMSEGQRWDSWTRRGLFGAGGLLTGGAAYAVWQALFAPGSVLLMTNRHDKVFTHLGSHDLLIESGLPTLAGFLCFFGVFFALINWTKQTDPLRTHRFGLWSLAASVIVGVLASTVFAFPTGAAVLWAGVISASVQLTSPGLSSKRA